MSYDIQLTLPSGWSSEQETYIDESGAEITHLGCHKPDDVHQTDEALIDVYVGPLPDDTSAADQALSNYADTVGFDDDDPDGFDPITEWPFNGKKAYGFEAECEDDSPMRMMCIEVKKGTLAIICIVAKDDDSLVEVIEYTERHLRIK